MGTTDADSVIADAARAGASKEAMNARRAMKLERRLKGELDEAREATDAAIVALKAKAGRRMSFDRIALLLGVSDRQTIHVRVKRHTKRAEEAR